MTRALILLTLAALAGCSDPGATRMLPSKVAVSEELSAEAPDIDAALTTWNAAFTCQHTLRAIAPAGDVALDPDAPTAAYFSHTDGRIYLGPQALERRAVTTLVLHELGHAHFAKHVPEDGSLFSAEVDAGDVTIDDAMRAAVCAADASCCGEQ